MDNDENFRLRKWMYHLGNPTQRRNVLYVEGSERHCRCLLCDTGYMNGSSITDHFQGSTHARKYRRVQTLEEEAAAAAAAEERRKLCASISAAAQRKIGLPRWRNEIKASMYDYIQTGNADDLTRTVKRFSLLEELSLLELALWKTNICDGIVFSSIQEMREYGVLDPAFDPNEYAKEKRVTSGCEVIIPLVLSFLKQE